MSTASTEPVWHYTTQNQRKGPVTLENLQTLVSRGRLNLQQDMVWNPEMSEWAMAGSVKELSKVKVDSSASPAPASAVKPQKVAETTSPYQTPKAPGAETGELQAAMEERIKYPGVGRLGYFLYPIFTVIAVCMLGIFIEKSTGGLESGPITWLVGMGMLLVLIVGLLYPTFGRLQNLGMSGWYFWLLLVPLINIWVNFRLFACPPGYAQHKKMDVIGWILSVIFLLGLVFYILVAVLFATNDDFRKEYMKAYEKGYREEIQRQRARQNQ